MFVKSPKFFGVSLLMLGFSALQLYLANIILETTATRNFNFGSPFAIVLAAMQIIVAIFGLVFSVGRKK